MILLWLILVPAIAGVVAWVASRWNDSAPRWLCLAGLAIDLVLAAVLWSNYQGAFAVSRHTVWIEEFNREWIPDLGIRFHLATDGLSLLLVTLSAFLGIMAVGISWREITYRVGLFHFNVMWVLAGLIGVFLAMDLFLFFFFWEMMLVPMYFLIAVWGHERRQYAAVKFFLFTQASGLLMLLAILGLYFIHGRSTGNYTFDYIELLGTQFSDTTGMLLMLGFLVAFAVKLPAFPLHPWLPDAHTEAPTAGSVILAGLMLKTGAYGILRFVLPFFPVAASQFAPIAMTLGVVGILYGALLAFAQTDLKRMVAYTSVSHMGFVLLGAFAGNDLALQGVMMEILCHGLSTGALFMIVGALQERLHTRDIREMGGLWTTMPWMGGVAMVMAMASLGLPGLGNFVAEFLILLGTYEVNVALAAVAAFGLVIASVYALWFIQVTFHGQLRVEPRGPDLSGREAAMMTAMIVALVWLGVYPQPVLDAFQPSVDVLQDQDGTAVQATRGRRFLTIPAELDIDALLHEPREKMEI